MLFKLLISFVTVIFINVATYPNVAAAAATKPTTTAATAQTIVPSTKTPTPPADLTANEIIKKMESTLVPPSPMITRGTLTHRTEIGDSQFWRMAVMRGTLDEDFRTLIVFDNGTALLAGKKNKTDDAFEALYIPIEGRVREIVPVYPEDAFLGTDLTKLDAGIAQPGQRTFKLFGTVELNHRIAYKIEEKPQSSSEFSRVVTWVAADDWMPMKREYFDRADRLWKVAQYRDMVIDGIPSIISVDMKDVQSDSETKYVVYEIRYDDAITEEVFRTARLGHTAKEFVW